MAKRKSGKFLLDPSFHSYCAMASALDGVEGLSRGLGRTRRFARGASVSLCGDHGFTMGVVIRGVVALCRLQENGNTRVLDFYGPNEVIHSAFFRRRDATSSQVVANGGLRYPKWAN